MEKKRIINYLNTRKVTLNQRVDMPNGGQYLENFLSDFARVVRDDLLNEQLSVLKQMKVENKNSQF